MGQKIIGILLAVVVLGAVLFFFQSGVVGRILSFGDSLDFSFTPSTGTLNYYNAPPTDTNQTPQADTSTNNSGEQAPDPKPVDAPEGFTEDQLSPHFEKVRIGSATAGSQFSYGRTTLRTNFSGDESINVTGWLLQANIGSQFVPQAVNVYDFSGITPESDIFMHSGDTLTLYTSQSAIGRNLRLNRCIGYLENTNKFTPSLPRNCPSFNSSETGGFTGKCQDYVRSLGSCRLPEANPNVPQTDYACRSFIETINYRGCVDRHGTDADFLSREIWAWTGNRFLDSRHDRVLLLDRDGLLVDIYNY